LGLVLFGNSEVTPLALHLSVDGDTFYPREPIYSRLVIVQEMGSNLNIQH
jgi:hypothetical protein